MLQLSPGDLINTYHWSPPLMEITSRLSLLFIVALKVAHAQLQSHTSDICELENTRATSTSTSFIPKKSVYPVSCPGVCFQRANCMATTNDTAVENCELHEAYADGAPCVSLSVRNGSTFFHDETSRNTLPKGETKERIPTDLTS